MKKDFNILNYFNMRSLFLGIGLSKILIDAKEMFWISLILGTLIGCAILKFIHIELKNKIVNTFVACVFFGIALTILLNMITTLYLTEMPKFIVGIPLILLIIYVISKKEITMFRVSDILIVINVTLFLAMFISLIHSINFMNFVFTNTPFTKVIFAALEYAIFSTVPTFITRHKKFSDESLIKTYLISSVTLSLLFFLTLGMLGPNLVETYRYPEYIILKNVRFFDTLANLENIISFIWIFDVLIFLICCANTIKKSINNNKITYGIIITLLFVISYLNKFYEFIIANYNYSFYVLTVCLAVLFIFNRKTHQDD